MTLNIEERVLDWIEDLKVERKPNASLYERALNTGINAVKLVGKFFLYGGIGEVYYKWQEKLSEDLGKRSNYFSLYALGAVSVINVAKLGVALLSSLHPYTTFLEYLSLGLFVESCLELIIRIPYVLIKKEHWDLVYLKFP